MHDIAQLDALQPFVRARARPTRYDEAQRGAVHRMDRFTVLREGDQVTRVHRLFDRHAARNRRLFRIAGKVRVGAVMGGVDDVVLNPGGLKHVGKPHAGPLRTGDSTQRPLVALGRRVEIGAAIAAAFDRQRQLDDLELRLQVGDTKFHRIVDQTVDG